MVENNIKKPQLPKHLPVKADLILADYGQFLGFCEINEDWSGQKAANVYFEQINLKQIILQQIRLEKLTANDAVFDRCDFSGALCEKGHFRRIEFKNCRLMGASLMEGVFEDILFAECNGEGANFFNAFFRRVKFYHVNLSGASFEGADLRGVEFIHCDLTRALFLNANLGGTDFRSSTIEEMQVGFTELRGAIFAPYQAVQMAGLLGIIIRENEI